MRLAHRPGSGFADAACVLPVVADLRLRAPAVPSRARMFREDSADAFFGDLDDPSQGTLWHLGDPRDDDRWLPFVVFWASRLRLRAGDQACWKLKQDVRAIGRIE
jgi:hypothetical protein